MGNFLKNLHPLLRRKKNEYDNKDPNYAIIDMFSEELNSIERDALDSRIQSSLNTATGKYLDIYGDWYGLYRKDDEKDETYRDRIIEYVLLKRGTNNSIIDAIRRFLEDEEIYVNVYEPFQNIFYTNKSHLNGEDHLMGDYYRFAIIDITIGKRFPLEIIEEINKFKPAGVKVFFTYDSSYETSEDKIITNVFPKRYPKVTTYQNVDIFRGYGRLLYGHLNLGMAKVNKISDVFKTNNSLINSLDVLSGSATVGREYYNFTYKTKDSYIPKPYDFVTSISVENRNVEGEELNKDFYTDTNTRDNLSPETTIKPSEDRTSIYFNFDINEYLRRNGINTVTLELDNKELREYVSNYFGEVTLDFDMKAMVSPTNKVNVSLSVYDFVSKVWVKISSENLDLNSKNIGNKLGNLLDYINNNLALFLRLNIEPVEQETNIQISYIDLFFNRYDKDIYTVKPFKGMVESYQETDYLFETDIIKDTSLENGDIITKSGYQPMQYLRLTDGYDNSINRNLLEGSGNYIKNNNYNTVWYYILDKIKENTEVTITIKAKLGEDVTSLGVYNDNGYVIGLLDKEGNQIIIPKEEFDENNIATVTGYWQTQRVVNGELYKTDNNRLFYYTFPKGHKDETEIIWSKLEYGNESTKYQPNPEDIYGANDPNKSIDVLPRDKNNNVIKNKVLPVNYREENVQFLDKIIRFNGVYNNVQAISIYNTIPIPKATIETSVYGEVYTPLKSLTNIQQGETHTDNELVDLYGIKNLTYQNLNPFSEAIIRPFMDYTITKLMEDIGNVVDIPKGFFNATWQEIDSYTEHHNPIPQVIQDVVDGVIDNSNGKVGKVPTPQVSTYTDVSTYTYKPAEDEIELTIDSEETIGKLKDVTLDTKTIKISTIPQVTTETIIKPLNN